MGLVTGALQIGRSALLAYQNALQVVGNNVSNVGNADYTRQSPVLSPVTGAPIAEGFIIGGGVALSGLKRNVDAALENRIRMALGDQAGALSQQRTMGRIESVMNELTDVDLSTLLQNFFNAFSSLQPKANDDGLRNIVLTAGNALVGELSRQREDMLHLRDELNQQIVQITGQANELATKIAQLNVQISQIEGSNRGNAGALRDQRDALLRNLSTLVQVQVREQPDGGMNVYVGNELLIQGGTSRGLTTTIETPDSQPRAVVRFADNNGTIKINGGELAGLIDSRDQQVMGHVRNLDSFAEALIFEVNRIHSQGQGLEGIGSVTGTYDVLDPNAVLNSAQAGLHFKPQNGSFVLTTVNTASGAPASAVIKVDLDGIGNDDSLQDLVDRINASGLNVTASITADHRLKIDAADGFQMYFSEDSSNVLATLGVNTFFAGHNAADIALNSDVAANANRLAVALNRTPGDGSNAGAIAALANAASSRLQGRSLTDYYNGIATGVGVQGKAARARLEAMDAITLSLSAERESISGVNLDEETVSLLRLERAFQGAARFTSVVDRMIEEMLAIVR